MNQSKANDNHFVPVTDSAALEQLFQTSNERPVVLFKHSLTCPVSAEAHDEMTGFPGQVHLVVVQSAREVADEIETRTGIRHESPQAILLVNGKPVWHASHWKIKAAVVTAAIEENS